MLKKIAHVTTVATSIVREKLKSARRSPDWDDLRDDFLSLCPYCEACGSQANLQVHHIIPFNVRPELELSYTNLIALCMGPNECHLKLGHGGSFRCYNPNVAQDVREYRNSDEAKKKLITENAKLNRKKD